MVQFLRENQRIPGAMKISQRLSITGGLEGSEEFFKQEFQRLMSSGNYEEASKLVAGSPGTILRNISTINVFKSL